MEGVATGVGAAGFGALTGCCTGVVVVPDVAGVLSVVLPAATDVVGVVTAEVVLLATGAASGASAACWTPLAVVVVAGASPDPPPPPQAARIRVITRREG